MTPHSTALTSGQRDLRYLWRSRWWIALAVVIGAAAAYAYSTTLPKTYTATSLAQIVPAQQADGRPLGSDELLQLTNVYAEQARSLPTISATWERTNRPMPFDEFRDALSLEVDPAGGLLELDADAPLGDQAQRIATAYATTVEEVVAEAQETQQRALIRRLTSAGRQIRARLERGTGDATADDALRVQGDALQARISEILATPRDSVRIIQPATVPTSASSPRPLLNAVLAGLLALVLATAVVFLRTIVGRRFSDADDVGAELGYPVLGRIPEGAADSGHLHEALRMVELSIEIALETPVSPPERTEPLGRVLLFTSATEHEGKTFLASHLARSMAAHGWRVLLIDADLRRPTVHLTHSRPLSPGLADVLDGGEVVTSIIDTPPAGGWVEGRLDVLSAGAADPSTISALASGRMADVLAQCRGLADFVILDAPPVLPVADPVALARYSDAVVFVVDVQRTKRRSAERAIEQLQATRAPILGVIANRTSDQIDTYGYAGHDPQPAAPPAQLEPQ